MPRVGVRVVRGPDWRWKDQDGGEGHVGTVIDIGLPHRTIPERTVLVQWDNGVKTNYRTGYQGAYDLRVYDNSQIGIRHPGVICDICKQESGIKGVRWKCAICEEINMCTVCYMSDKHDLNHSFERIDQPNEPCIPLQPRGKSRRVEARGIYPGALVVRGDDWDWGDQDGGAGQHGKVLNIQDWENESARSVACIQWLSNRTKNVYRVGHKGKMDLRLAPPTDSSATSGLPYYPEHLPILGSSQVHAEIMAKCAFRKGDRVRVGVDLDTLKRMQEGHGGWNDNMARYVGAVGTVHRITERGDVRVRFERYECRWTFNPAALIPLPRRSFAVGDVVQISADEETIREAQQHQGAWCSEMQKLVGARGVVVRVCPDRDLLVRVGDTTWTLNRSVCASIPDVVPRFGVATPGRRSPSANRDNCGSGSRHRGGLYSHLGAAGDERLPSHHEANLNEIVARLQECKANSEMGPDRLVKEAAQGHYAIVKEIIANFPESVDVKVSGKTALQVACHEGHLEMVDLLLSKNAALGATDEEGDTPLHYSCFGNKPHVTDFLLKRGADVNALNRTRCSALHVSVNKQYEGCVRTLLHFGASVNLQDSYGDTALHDAITKNADGSVVLEMLVAQPHLDMSLKNKAGFNYLHHAALKGNAFAARQLIARQPSLVDVKKDDGFAALHLAALNGHREVTLCLLEGGANVDIKNHRQQTPVSLAVSQGHVNVLDVLIDYKCALELSDEDGNNPLHLAAKLAEGTEFNLEAEEKLNDMKERVLKDFPPAANYPMNRELLAAMYLVEKGCVTVKQWHNLRNKRRKSPSELVHCESSRAILSSWAHYCTLARLPRWAICMVCQADLAEVIFQPCKDKVTCTHCCAKMKRCIKCHAVIDSKCKEDGSEIPQTVPGLNVVAQDSQDIREELNALRSRIQELEDSVQCSICMDASRSVAFLCGHSACVDCAETLQQCHMCRKPIQKKINLF